MKEQMKITVVAGKSLPETLAKSFNALASALSAGIANTKLTAEKCYELRTNPDFKATFAKADDKDGNGAFKDIIDDAFNGIITGNTAYKYAQCYELYHSNADVWEYFPIGKMIITSRLESNTKETGRSTAKFIQWVGVDYNVEIQAKLDKWVEVNSKQLQKIKCLEDAGLDATAEKKALTPQPKEKPYVSTGNITADGEYFTATGLAVILRKTDKELKLLVNRYIDNNLTDKEIKAIDEKAESKSKSKNKAKDKPVDVLENAIVALTAYASTLSPVPAEYSKAILKLKADKEKKEGVA